MKKDKYPKQSKKTLIYKKPMQNKSKQTSFSNIVKNKELKHLLKQNPSNLQNTNLFYLGCKEVDFSQPIL
jgi:hypothetical protein